MGQIGSLIRRNSIDDKSTSITKTDHNNADNISTLLYNRKLLKRCEHIHFDVEAWYKILQCQTFYTEFIPISSSIAQAFVNYYQTRYNSKKFLKSNDIQLIQSIQDQLKEKILHLKTNQLQINSMFIRLSARSPKDGDPLNLQKLIQIYHDELNRLQIKYPNEYDTIEGKANIQLIAYCYAQFQSLQVTNEFEALNLILSSERVFIDLLDALRCEEIQNNKDRNLNNIQLYEWNNHIIIRQWNNLLDPSMEFRCFVYQSKLTAISQYNHYCKFYHLQNDEIIQQIKNTIIKYWQEIIQPLFQPFNDTYHNYIIDIGLIDNKLSNEFECIVIELNPFATSTGASLFDWNTDINQLTGQLNEIEIRIRSNYLPNINEYVTFIFQENKLNIEDNLVVDDVDRKPYYTFLNEIQTQISS